MSVDDSKPVIMSVAELNRRGRELIETGLPLLWVAGEVSNFVRGGFRTLLFLPQGRHRAGALRLFPAQSGADRLEAGERHAGRSARAADLVRGARRVSADRGEHAPLRPGGVVRGIRAAQTQAGTGRPVRRFAPQTGSRVSPLGWRGYIAKGRRVARCAHHAGAAHARHSRGDLSGSGAGRRRG